WVAAARVLVRLDVDGRPEALDWRSEPAEVELRAVKPAPVGRRVLHVIGKIGEGAGGASTVDGPDGLGVARRRRVEHGAPVRTAVAAADALRVTGLLAVVIRADHIDRVGQSGRRVDVLVVPALARAEIDRRIVRARRYVL